MTAQKSIVLVTVDCLRADHVGFGGCSRPVTPFLGSLATSSVVFSDAIVAGAPTYFSFPAILASRYALALGRDVLGIAPGEPTIATALRDAGCTTAAFVAGNPYLSSQCGYDQGFDHFEDFADSAHSVGPARSIPATPGRMSGFNRRLQSASRRTRWSAAAYDELYFWYCQRRSASDKVSFDSLRAYPAADAIVDRACSWIANVRDTPFFLWLHFMDPHHPYYPPQEALAAVGAPHITAARARFLNSFWNRGDIGPARLQKYRRDILSLYDAGVYWVDKQISRLVRTLQQMQRWDHTVFAVTGDHGEEFLEHGTRYHSPTNLAEQLIKVPLLLRAPGVSATRISEGPFSLIHLAPTLLQSSGVSVPVTFQGRGYWSEISAGHAPSEPAIAECIAGCNNPMRPSDRMRPRLMAIRDRQHKLVIDFGKKTDRLYDLKTDPSENAPLENGALTRARARLLQAARAHLQKTSGGQHAELALRARLRELKQAMGTGRKATQNTVASD